MGNTLPPAATGCASELLSVTLSSAGAMCSAIFDLLAPFAAGPAVTVCMWASQLHPSLAGLRLVPHASPRLTELPHLHTPATSRPLLPLGPLLLPGRHHVLHKHSPAKHGGGAGGDRGRDVPNMTISSF